MAAVNFCRPPGMSDTVCHNVPCSLTRFPELPAIPLRCGTDSLCGPPNITTVPPITDSMTTITSSTTPPPEVPAIIITCVIILVLIVIMVLFVLGLLYRKRRRDHQKDVDQPDSTKQSLPEVELQSNPRTCDTPDNGNNGIGNATVETGAQDPAQGTSPQLKSPTEETKLFKESAAGAASSRKEVHEDDTPM